jgi:hypothetical protein
VRLPRHATNALCKVCARLLKSVKNFLNRSLLRWRWSSLAKQNPALRSPGQSSEHLRHLTDLQRHVECTTALFVLPWFTPGEGGPSGALGVFTARASSARLALSGAGARWSSGPLSGRFKQDRLPSRSQNRTSAGQTPALVIARQAVDLVKLRVEPRGFEPLTSWMQTRNR